MTDKAAALLYALITRLSWLIAPWALHRIYTSLKAMERHQRWHLLLRTGLVLTAVATAGLTVSYAALGHAATLAAATALQMAGLAGLALTRDITALTWRDRFAATVILAGCVAFATSAPSAIDQPHPIVDQVLMGGEWVAAAGLGLMVVLGGVRWWNLRAAIVAIAGFGSLLIGASDFISGLNDLDTVWFFACSTLLSAIGTALTGMACCWHWRIGPKPTPVPANVIPFRPHPSPNLPDAAAIAS